MKPGILEALELARQGIPPTPEPRSPRVQPMQDLHEQLLASLQERSNGSVPNTVPIASTVRTQTGPPGQGSVQQSAPYDNPSADKRSRTKFDAHSRARKGTIEEVLGETSADPRASDASIQHDEAPPIPAVPAHQAPAALSLRCPICEGKGFLTAGETTRWCGRCGGEGFVADPAVPKTVLTEEVTDVVEPTSDERERGGAPHMGHADHDPAGDPNAQALTYDLPTSLDTLPPFCFICGPAGTGKTFQAKEWSRNDPEGVVLAATTGIAAVNLGEGTTINALLRYYDTQSLTDAYTNGWLESQLKRQRGAGLRRIVLDETSMLSGDQLTILTRAIDNVNQDRGGDDQELGLILVGDFAQLPPVSEPFAFESAEWSRYQRATYGLTTIRRQADQDFIEALQAVRRSDVARALEFFADRLEQATHPSFDGTTVFAKNDAVDRYNQLRLDKLHGAPVEVTSSRWGKLRSEWGGDPQPAYKWGVPQTLKLKIGALVMILANRNIAERIPGSTEYVPPEYLYVNGDLGTLVDAKDGHATVILQRTNEPVEVIPITRENVIPLEVGRRKALREEGHPERISANGKQEVIGACCYMPLRLAWGTTVHKSQGLSLDTVQLQLRDHFWTKPHMLYVGLSRCRTAEGLRIVGNVEGFRARINVDPKVKPWLT